jgi:uncharacterized repeat protein (TIGR01451 family)
MKTNLLRLFLIFYFSFFIFNSSSAQYVLIPDTNFRNFLMSNGFAGCMQGNTLDTTCLQVINATKINCSQSNIYDIEGIQYFDNLDTLICDRDSILILPPLPSGLTYFSVEINRITALPQFPPTLIYLNCNVNQLTSLPALPPGLKNLNCNFNNLVSLPTLPSTLNYLTVAANSLTSIPSLPPLLSTLSCSENQLTSIPALPSSLRLLHCFTNPLSSLPGLANLEILECSGCQLASLPPLPSTLARLSCQVNQLASLPALPSGLEYLNCAYNQLTTLPPLPADLIELYVSFNPLTSLPAVLPANLENFSCDSIGMSFLPPLPSTLLTLSCNFNNLTSLPPLPSALYNLSCKNNFITTVQSLPEDMFLCNLRNNQLTSIGYLPDSINYLWIDTNPIACFPELKKIGTLYWTSTNIHCLPNSGHIYGSWPNINSIGLCQVTDSCPVLWNITGQVFFDTDSSCTQDTGEALLRNIPVVLDSGGIEQQRFLTDNEGHYSFRTGLGSYTIRVDTLYAPFRVVCPATFFETSLLNVADSMDTIPSFGLLCKGIDLNAQSISPFYFFSPGFQNTVCLNIGEAMSRHGRSCANGISGNVQAILNNLITYISPAAGALSPASISGDTITWNIADFSSINSLYDFNIIVEVSTSATINDSICIELNVSPAAGDNIPSNNTLSECFPVRGSFDPNEKYTSPSGDVDTSQQWFTFTIFFQNIGTASAEDIYILDTLDQNLDATTFTYLSSSHDVITQMLPGNILRFNYPNINLADSTTNELASHGFVKFKVKRKGNLPVNTTITNTAHIFFDFNAAVVTNTTSATLTTSVGMTENVSEGIILYPNPAQSQLTVYSRQYTMSSIEILNSMGQQVYVLKADKSKRETIGVENFAKGIYIVKITLENKIVVERFIKQ